MARTPSPNSYIVDLDHVIDLVNKEIIRVGVPKGYYNTDVDIVIPVYEALGEDVAKHIVWLLDHKMFTSIKSRFIECMESKRENNDTFHIYDKFKSNGYEHKKSYKHLVVEVPYVDDTAEPIFIPVYWRVN